MVGSPAATSLLASLAPALGVNALTQAAVLQALQSRRPRHRSAGATVIEQRLALREAIEDLPVEMPDSQANFVWLRAEGMTGDELATRLEQARVLVAPGGPLGDERYIRAAIRDAHGDRPAHLGAPGGARRTRASAGTRTLRRFSEERPRGGLPRAGRGRRGRGLHAARHRSARAGGTRST